MFLLKPSRKDFQILLALAIPLLLGGLVESSIGFFSTFFLAHLSKKALAAGALSGWLFATMMVIFWGTLTAISALISRKFGENDTKAISQILRDSLILAFLLALPSFLLLRYLPGLFELLGQPTSLISLAYTYVDAQSWTVLPDFLGMVLLQFLIGLGRTKVSFAFTLIWVPINIMSNWVLIFGKWGFPALGIAGIGWGMTFSFWITSLGLFLYLWLHSDYRVYLKGMLTLSPLIHIKELLKVGLPIGGMFCVELGFFLILTLIMGQFGSLYLAANQLVLQFLGLVTSMSFSMAGAITVRMGHMLGEKNSAAAGRALSAGTLMAALLMAIVGLLYVFFPSQLIGIDLDLNQPDNYIVFDVARNFLVFGAFFELFESIRISFYGALRALKDTHFSFLSSIISFWCIPLPLGWFLVHKLHWGPNAYWMGMVVGAICGILLLASRLNRKMDQVVYALRD